MKLIYKYPMFLLVALAAGGIFFACSDEDLPNNGEPMISYIRITDPASSDSLVVSAGQGQMIAIMGENLGGARSLWINDQQAILSPTFITNNAIITRVPAQIPKEITNQMRVLFADGKSLTYDFAVDISEPLISYMKSEYVNTGEVATINGNFFYEPLVVTFSGGVEAELLSVEDEMIQVKVPDGAQPGPITITSNFGESESSFWFRDNRNLIASFDGTTSGLWHGAELIVSSDDDIEPIDGKFIRLKTDLGAWGWYEMYVGPSDSDVAIELKNIPADAFENPDRYSLKFEINTLKSLTGAAIHMYIGPDMAGKRNDVNYNWQPNINTGGEWETVTIPWDDVYEANKEFAFNPNGYGISIHFSGPSPVTADFGLDNMRVVPN
jgi:Surface glycan-binding protein B xyloglucan binding domain